MKIYFVVGDPITCGGINICYEYVSRLQKLGYDARLIASWTNDDLEQTYGVKHEKLEGMQTSGKDIIIAVRWEMCEALEKYAGKKFQLVQGNDRLYYELINHQDLQKMIDTRNNPNWELIGVSRYCLENWGRGKIVPNGVSERFHINNITKDIDVLIIGNEEENKGINLAYQIALPLDCKIARLGREVLPRESIELIFENPAQSEIPKIYQRSKVALIMSKSEGFSLPILEAMASGCAVITRPMGGNDFCLYGWNCERENMLEKVLRDEEYRKILIANGKETAKEYTWSKATTKILTVLGISDIM